MAAMMCKSDARDAIESSLVLGRKCWELCKQSLLEDIRRKRRVGVWLEVFKYCQIPVKLKTTCWMRVASAGAGVELGMKRAKEKG